MPKEKFLGCLIKELPANSTQDAADTAIELNPVNKPNSLGLESLLMADGDVDIPQAIAMLVSKYHGAGGVQLGVSFLDSPKQDLIDRILSHMNVWGQYGNIKFMWSQSGGEVRISRGPGGYWSYLGTDIYHIAKGSPTMNLEGFTMTTPESEYKRVVRHEVAHTLGCPHEHLRKKIIDRLDVKKTIDYFRRYSGWSEAMTRQQVLTPIEEKSVLGTPVDVTSIMCYRLPGSITKDGKPIPGGDDLDASDKDFISKVYPKPSAACPEDATVGLFLDMNRKTVKLPAGWSVE